jgi:flavorubredoxin
MLATPIAENIWWVGAIDWNLRDFHGYDTPRGTTYNSYLVRGAEKTALVDTVKTPFVPELLSRVRSIVPLESVDYIVVNHIEPDHNSGLRAVMDAMPQAKVVASPVGVKGIAEYHDGLVVEPVTKDDTLDLGGKTLKFLPEPMVHWPDSMFTYCVEDCVLLPNDAFGQHLASCERFADQFTGCEPMEELKTYYANILMPLGTQVGKAVDKIKELGWVCHVIAPSHGVAWRGVDILRLLDAYTEWSSGVLKDKVVVAYATMWGSTDMMAKQVADGIMAEGTECYLADVRHTAHSAIMTELLDARGLVVGSPTLHHGVLSQVAGFMQYVAGLKPKDRFAGAFGSYGWSSGATKQMTARLEEIGFELPFADFTVKYKPNAAEEAATRDWGAQFGRLSRERD